MRVILGDESWHWDPDEITVEEAIAIEEATGLPYGPFRIGLVQQSGVAVRGLIWFLRQRVQPGYQISWIKDLRISDVRVQDDPPVSRRPPTKTRAPKKATGGRRAPRTSKTSAAS